MKIKLYDQNGKELSGKESQIDLVVADTDKNVLAQYVRVYSTNQRQGTSKVKTRAEVSGGGKKPWKQKGTGRARVGSNRSPLWRSGGVIHGPEPKDWNIKMPKKVKKQSFILALQAKLQSESIVLFEFGNEIKTKLASNLINSMDLQDKNVLVLHNKNVGVYKSFKNIPNVLVQNIDEVNSFSLLFADNVLIEKESFDVFKAKFLNENEK